MAFIDDDSIQVPIPHTYPVNVIVHGHSALVVGGGQVAARKARGLRRAGARITLIAPEAIPELKSDPTIAWKQRKYRSADVPGHRLVMTATNDPAVNAKVASDARRAGVLVNSADDPPNCDFILPALGQSGDLTVAVSTRGRSPAVATWLRKRLERELDWRYRTLLEIAADVRTEVRHTYGTSELPGWGEGLDTAFESIATGDTDGARSDLRRRFRLDPEAVTPRPGEVLR